MEAKVGAVRRLRLKRAGVHMHLRAEHFKTWLRKAYPKIEATAPPNPDKWMKLVELVQFVWEHRTIPEELGWKILILTPKGNTDIQVIGILEVFWKVMEAIIDTLMKKDVTFHDNLHGFRAGRGTRTAIMELEFTQELVCVHRDPLLLVFLYLKNIMTNWTEAGY